jgi:hypothetical protein
MKDGQHPRVDRFLLESRQTVSAPVKTMRRRGLTRYDM